MAVGDNIRRYREARGMTQTELAKRCGITLQMINQVEHGRRLASVAILADAADALGVSADTLIGRQAPGAGNENTEGRSLT